MVSDFVYSIWFLAGVGFSFLFGCGVGYVLKFVREKFGKVAMWLTALFMFLILLMLLPSPLLEWICMSLGIFIVSSIAWFLSLPPSF